MIVDREIVATYPRRLTCLGGTMSRSTISAAARLLITLPLAFSLASAQTPQRLPSEVLHDVIRWRLANLSAAPTQVEAAVTPFVTQARTSGLSPDEEVALGMAYFFSFDGLRAKPLLEKHRDRDDLLGRVSWQAVQQMTFMGAKDYALGERRTTEFRQKFRPVVEDLEYTYVMVNNLARQSATNGDHVRVAQLIMDDLRGVPLGLPFRSYENLARHYESFKKAGRDPDALALMREHLNAMRTRAAAETRTLSETPTPPAASLEYAHRPGVLHLFPFQTWLFNDDPRYTIADATVLATRRAIDQFAAWVGAADSGRPLPTW
jgi:hypothetical protein